MDAKDKERLVEVHTDTQWLKAAFITHLGEHFRVRILCIGSAIAAIAALLIALV